MKKYIVQSLDIVGGWLHTFGCWLIGHSLKLDMRWNSVQWEKEE